MKKLLFTAIMAFPMLAFSQVTVQEDDAQSLWKGVVGYELVSEQTSQGKEYKFYYRNSEKGAKLEEQSLSFNNREDAVTFFETGLKTLETGKEYSLTIGKASFRMYKSVGTLVFSGRSSSGILNKTQILRLLEVLDQQKK